MLRRLSDLRGTAVAAVDGEAGSVEDLYFDANSWVVQRLGVEVDDVPPGRLTGEPLDHHPNCPGLYRG